MGFKFDVKHDVAVPEIISGGGGKSLGIPFGDMKVNSHVFVPREFWPEVNSKINDAHIDGEKGPADLRDRIRRSFYGWRDAEKAKRGNLSLTMQDKRDEKTKKYLGVDVYMVHAEGAQPAKPGPQTNKKKAA